MRRLEDPELVAKATNGSPDAFAELVQRYRDAVYGYCYWRTRNRDDAQDLCQETFVRAFTRMDQLQDGTKLGAWLRIIAANLCTRWSQSRRETPMAELPLNDPPYPSPTLDDVHDALTRIPPKERQSVVLHYVYGLSYDEIAALLKVSKGVIRNRLQRGRDNLRTEVLAMESSTHKDDRATGGMVKEFPQADTFTRLGLGWSPDGQMILYMRHMEGGMQLWISDETGKLARPISEIGWEEDYGWTPDSKRILFGYAPRRDNAEPGSLHVYAVGAGTAQELSSGYKWWEFEEFTGWAKPVWTKDGRQFALLMKRTPTDAADCAAFLFDMHTGQRQCVAPDFDQSGIMHPGDWMPDGKAFLFYGRSLQEGKPRHCIWAWSRSDGSLTPLTPAEWIIASDPRVSPDGQWVAFTTSHGRPEAEQAVNFADLWLMRPDGTETRRLTDGSNAVPTRRMTFRNPEWTGNGKYIVCLTTRYDASRRHWDGAHLVDSASGELISVLQSDPESERYITGFRDKITCSANGKRLAFTTAEYTVSDRDSETPSFTNRSDVLYYYDIASRSLHEALRTYPERDGIELFTGGYFWVPALSPDGRKMLFTRATVIDPDPWNRPDPEGGRLLAAVESVFDTKQAKATPQMCIFEIS